jgi:hypothetical protein
MEEKWNGIELRMAGEEQRPCWSIGACVSKCVCIEHPLSNCLGCVPLYQSQRSSAAA